VLGAGTAPGGGSAARELDGTLRVGSALPAAGRARAAGTCGCGTRRGGCWGVQCWQD